jgi:hypothetical protein
MFHGVGDGYLDVFLDVVTTVARCTNKKLFFVAMFFFSLQLLVCFIEMYRHGDRDRWYVLSYVAVAYVFDGATSDLVTCFKHSLSCFL